MKDDEKMKLETLDGFTCSRPELMARFVVDGPRNRLEALWWMAIDLWHEVILPSLLFALAFTAFKFALFA
jgi:hypothetical protein